MIKKTETPRADAALIAKYVDGSGNRLPYVSADFARELERELTAANAKNANHILYANRIRELTLELASDQSIYATAIQDLKLKLSESMATVELMREALNSARTSVQFASEEEVQESGGPCIANQAHLAILLLESALATPPSTALVEHEKATRNKALDDAVNKAMIGDWWNCSDETMKGRIERLKTP